MRYLRVNIYDNINSCEDYYNFQLNEIDEAFNEWTEQSKKFPEPDYEVAIYLMSENEDCADDMIDACNPILGGKEDYDWWLKSHNIIK